LVRENRIFRKVLGTLAVKLVEQFWTVNAVFVLIVKIIVIGAVEEGFLIDFNKTLCIFVLLVKIDWKVICYIPLFINEVQTDEHEADPSKLLIPNGPQVGNVI
jgi:hypothetical protein